MTTTTIHRDRLGSGRRRHHVRATQLAALVDRNLRTTAACRSC